MTPSDEQLVDIKIETAIARMRAERWQALYWIVTAAAFAGLVAAVLLAPCG